MKHKYKLIALLISFVSIPLWGNDLNEQLWDAARKGNLTVIQDLLAKGADINAKTRYGTTALFYAADHGQLETVKLLIEKGAEVNIKDTFYGSTLISWVANKGNADIIRILLKNGADKEDALMTAIDANKTEAIKVVLEFPGIKGETLTDALQQANQSGQTELADLLKKAGATLPEIPQIDTEILKMYTGSYKNPEGNELKVDLTGDHLMLQLTGQEPFPVSAIDETTFNLGSGTTIVFHRKENKTSGFTVNRPDGSTSLYFRMEAAAQAQTPAPVPPPPPASGSAAQMKEKKKDTPGHWPSFRGNNASGIADKQQPPITWDVPKSQNIVWKMPIAGLAHSSPVVWGDRVFITSAISSDPKAALRHGLYGDVEPDNDLSKHMWVLYCIDRVSGKLLWWKMAQEAIPRVKRHPKSSQSNSTPVVDGKHVVIVLGSGDLLCYDFHGKLLWREDLGTLNSGWFFDPEYEWGFGSSPIIYKDTVILQVDLQKNSYLAAFKLKNGTRVWSTPREEIPSWGTPTIYAGSARTELITNGTNFIRGYDPETGKELWRLAGNSEITVPTPIAADGLIYVTSGYRPIQPIYAIRPGASGDITLPKDKETNDWVVWSKARGGPYMPTPIVYNGYLYTLANNGVLTCYNAKTGEKIYQERLGGKGSAYAFTASPVAADGRLYFTSEDGEIFVLRAGPVYEVLSVNQMGEVCLATPAITRGMIIFRTQNQVVAVSHLPMSEEKKQ